MAHRSPARFLAPLALVACRLRPLHGRQSPQTELGRQRAHQTAPPTVRRNAHAGTQGPAPLSRQGRDTPSSIAEKTGVPLEDILRLNPDLDPQTIQVGQRIRLRQ